MRWVFAAFGLGLLALIGIVLWQRGEQTASTATTTNPPSVGFAPAAPVEGPSLDELEASLPDAAYRIVTNDPGLLARGEVVYRTSCAVCHGGNLAGQPNWRTRGADGNLPAPPHDETGHTWHHSDEVLFNLVKYGPGFYTPGYSGKMPAYEALLEDRDIKAVNSWIASTWPTEILLAQRERTLASEKQQ